MFSLVPKIRIMRVFNLSIEKTIFRKKSNPINRFSADDLNHSLSKEIESKD